MTAVAKMTLPAFPAPRPVSTRRLSGGAALGAIDRNCCTASLVSSAAHSIAGGVVTGTAARWRPPAEASDLDQLHDHLISLRADVFPFEWIGIHIVP